MRYSGGMTKLSAFPALVLLAGCATVPVSHPVQSGGLVTLGQPVQVGKLVATPSEMVEDSRCPENVRCVWAGRLIVSTRIDGGDWRETVPLTLGAPYATHDTSIMLVTGLPEKQAGVETEPKDYRFAFEGGR